ncbi:sensor histidine kinase [Candidatus Leptofilum sp.]|uniref:sensor histidine kinase n=1 Tax=Candidatus Leptofilum sp. TaxID=3241576 RepID=UPI003B5BC6DB
MFPKIRWRIAISYLILVTIVMTGLASYLSRPGCLGDAGCVRQAVSFTAVLLLVLAAVVAFPVAARTTQPVQQLTSVIRRITGGEWEARILPLTRDEMGELIFAFNNMIDTLRQQHLTLLQDNGQLETVLNYMADGVLITDSVGRVRLINPAASKLFSLSEKSALERTFAEVVRHHQLIDLWHACQEEEQVVTAAVELGRVFLQVIITPFKEGWAEGYLVILQDLTTMRHLQTVRSDFISNVSHELRTPLASLQVIIETLQDGAYDDPETAVRFLDRAAAEIDVLTQMVEELLELSRIESGQVPLRLQATAVADLLLGPMDRLKPQAERASLNLILDLPAALPLVLADPTRIHQVVSNLLHNAIKFTPDGGNITLKAEADEEKNEVVITIQDNGIGIAQEELGRIFERFYKSDRARTRSLGGTGLGLAISRHIVQVHNGRMWVHSKENKGSSFFFTLPTSS